MSLITNTRVATGLILLATLTGCGSQEADVGSTSSSSTAAIATATAPPVLDVLQPRAQLMPGVGAVYLTITNSGGQDDRLIAIDTADASVAETHETVAEDGVMRMVPRPEGFAIPAGGQVELAPSGKHIMLIEPQPAIEEGGTLQLTLRFETSDPITIEATVATPVAGGHGMEHDMEHDTPHVMEHD